MRGLGHEIRVAAVETAGPLSRSGDCLEALDRASRSGADLVMLPQLSFTDYFPAARDRSALELGERAPFASLDQAAERCGDALLFASVYECVGEGVFYVRGELVAGGESLAFDRQRKVEGVSGRYEQMFFSPGHGPRTVARTSLGRVGMLLGADARDPSAYSDLASRGAELILGAVSETDEGWRVASEVGKGMAAGLGVAVAMVNRAGEPTFPGGGWAASTGGAAPNERQDGTWTFDVERAGEDLP